MFPIGLGAILVIARTAIEVGAFATLAVVFTAALPTLLIAEKKPMRDKQAPAIHHRQ